MTVRKGREYFECRTDFFSVSGQINYPVWFCIKNKKKNQTIINIFLV